MAGKLSSRRIAILATNGFEQSELFEPLEALKKEGATVDIVSLDMGSIKGWSKKDWGKAIDVDLKVSEAKAAGYDGLVLPGGVMNPDTLRRDEDVQKFVRAFFEAGKPVAAICHGPWTLIDAGVVKGRKVTSYHTIQTDLKNAGAIWSDEEVVVDKGLVTSRKPSDLPAFNKKMIEEFAEGRHQAQGAGG